MKKVAIVLLVLVIGMTFMSCSKEEIIVVDDTEVCGILNGWYNASSDEGKEYYLNITTDYGYTFVRVSFDVYAQESSWEEIDRPICVTKNNFN